MFLKNASSFDFNIKASYINYEGINHIKFEIETKYQVDSDGGLKEL
ncbi:hypothetical protein B4081_1498 [Bacillus cereus]|nr:hypothetical protein B4081_1498 [Bacillus cereus]